MRLLQAKPVKISRHIICRHNSLLQVKSAVNTQLSSDA
jgi:hypothetical protein